MRRDCPVDVKRGGTDGMRERPDRRIGHLCVVELRETLSSQEPEN